ncbi:hypothetical protein MVEG_04287 [Podila verticillata NRRL 6337]|nr:hypothetical protein MVEG_04287 [Podila verticillata NRRL 6337]
MESDENIDFLTECIKKYPNNKFFLQLRGCLYNFIYKHELALRDFIRIEEISKDDVDNLYHKAGTLRLMGRDKQATDAYTKFLFVASADHRNVPEAYYSLGICSMANRNTDSIARHYEQGLNAEEKQIPFFLPYESTSKEMLELMLRHIGRLSKGKEKPVVKLADPFRKELIVNHRRGISEYGKIISSDEHVKFNFTAKPPKSQSAPLSWVGLKPIYLNEINPTSDHVLDGFVLELTLITVPFNNNMSISFVAEDSNLNVQRVSLYNFDKKHNLAIGAKISVINPYLRTAMDGRPLIRIDDPNSVIVSPHQIVDMCHYCGKGQSKYCCSKCKRSKYCSKECQTLDWKEYSHKLICIL